MKSSLEPSDCKRDGCVWNQHGKQILIFISPSGESKYENLCHTLRSSFIE